MADLETSLGQIAHQNDNDRRYEEFVRRYQPQSLAEYFEAKFRGGIRPDGTFANIPGKGPTVSGPIRPFAEEQSRMPPARMPNGMWNMATPIDATQPVWSDTPGPGIVQNKRQAFEWNMNNRNLQDAHDRSSESNNYLYELFRRNKLPYWQLMQILGSIRGREAANAAQDRRLQGQNWRM